MTGLLGFLGALLSFCLLLFQEYQKRAADATARNEKYQVDQAEFQALVSAVLTRLRLQASAESQAARKLEDEIEKSRQEREKTS